MKFLVSLLFVASLSISTKLMAQSQTITATVVNVSSDDGKVGFALYSKDNFMKKPIQSINGIIENGKTKVVFKNVPKGDYAIICFHDKNNNDKMDFQPNGMPLEDYGASNNVMTFGPPTFENARFTVSDKNVSLNIKF